MFHSTIQIKSMSWLCPINAPFTSFDSEFERVKTGVLKLYKTYSFKVIRKLSNPILTGSPAGDSTRMLKEPM